MKLLFLVSRYTPHGVGGAERVAETLAQSLTQRGHEVVVLTTALEGDDRERVVNGIRVRTIPLRNVYDFSARPFALLKPIWHLLDSRNRFMRAAIDRVLDEEQPEVMHSHLVTGFSPIAWDVAKARGIRVVHTLHDHYVICARSSMALGGVACRDQHVFCSALVGPRIRSAEKVDAVVGVSEYIVNQHRKYGAFSKTQAGVIPNPCHLVGKSAARPASPAGRDRPLRIGFLGRIELNKGVDRLLATTRALPREGWTLDLAGAVEEPLAARLRSEFESDRIRFRGRVDPRAFLSELDLLAAPSTFPETFGMSVAESLALGVPVVASTVGALPELVSSGRNGFLVDPLVEGALTAILTRIIENPSMIEVMPDACRSSVAHLRPDLVASSYEQLYQRVVRAPSY